MSRSIKSESPTSGWGDSGSLKEKICFPLRGPLSNNSKQSRVGAPPGPLPGNAWPGFPHLVIARVVRLSPALIALEETNFLSSGRIPFAGGGVGTCEAHRKNGLSRPTERGRLNPFINLNQQLPNPLLFFSPSLLIWKTAAVLLDNGSIRRPSVRGRRRDSALEGEEIFSIL